MSIWVSPSIPRLKEVITSSEGHLILCSPYISTPALDIVYESLPKSVDTLEIWTRLDTRDWLTGASDPEGLLDFIREANEQVGPIPIRYSSDLHAKIIISDGPLAMAGSANLTLGGFHRNQEVARVVTDEEIGQLRAIANEIRPRLTPVSQKQFAEFVSTCVSKMDSREALLDLIRSEIPDIDLGTHSLTPYQALLEYLATDQNAIGKELLRIARNFDGNNNTGKVKQAFFGVQRFLQEYPHHRPFVSDLPNNKWFDVADSDLAQDWIQFLQDYSTEVNDAFGYSIPTLRRYLTPSSGGTLTGGGGGVNELKRIWPIIGKVLTTD